MNLVNDPWIPIRRRSGAEERIAPWQLTELKDPPVEVAGPRADFDGALIQFLIGLVQSTLPPRDPRDWRRKLSEPPPPEALEDAFASLEPYFELLGEGPRALQDLELPEDPKKGLSINQLLIDAPGGNTLKEAKDHFVKRGLVDALCPPCAATALLTLQINAPAGGQGHRTGLRGGGPLTSLVLPSGPSILWETVWLNVLDRGALESLTGNSRLSELAARFPWLAPTRTSETRGGAATTPEDAHPLQMHWPMPRRIRLHRPDSEETAICDLCLEQTQGPLRVYSTKNFGMNYLGAWVHPLSPHRRTKDDIPLPLHGSPQGLSYRQWLGLALEDRESGIEPAAVVERAKKDLALESPRLRLWAFGYDMDNMKARAWVEGLQPLFLPNSEESQLALQQEAEVRVLAAVQAQQALRQAVRHGLSRRPKDLKGEFVEAEIRFWQETEAPFFRQIGELVEALPSEVEEQPLRSEWLRFLQAKAEEIFHQITQIGWFQAVNPRQIVEAGLGLRRTLRGPKIRKALGLNRSI